MELRAARVSETGEVRAGLAGFLGRVRARAERAVSAGLDPDQAALARGFVLGQDDRIDELTREEFRRSGLSHLLSYYQVGITSMALQPS